MRRLSTRYENKCKGNPTDRGPDEPIEPCIDLLESVCDKDELHKETQDLEDVLQEGVAKGHTGIAAHPRRQCLRRTEESAPNGPHELDRRVVRFGNALTDKAERNGLERPRDHKDPSRRLQPSAQLFFPRRNHGSTQERSRRKRDSGQLGIHTGHLFMQAITLNRINRHNRINTLLHPMESQI